MESLIAVFIPIFAALINLSTPGEYVNFGVISISAANFVVVILMTVVFFLAIFLPFPGKKERTK